ncbi:MAG: hypothetical protein ACM3JE_02410 [Betaproteobacteria bacterium]
MGKFLSCSQLYQAIQEESADTREVLWVCSQQIGADAHKVFSQRIVQTPPTNVRFVFPLNDLTVKRGEVNPYEVQFLKERFQDESVKVNAQVNSNIYIFDDSAFITSAVLTIGAFESNFEVGVMIDGLELEGVKAFFEQNVWHNSKPVGDLKKQKRLWNLSQKNAFKKLKSNKRITAHTQLIEWTDDVFSIWYLGVLNRLLAKTTSRVRGETNWGRELLFVGDVGYQAFRELKLGDVAYLADLNMRPGKVVVHLVRVSDKSRVETDEGDYHILCRVEKDYTLEREDFYGLLKTLGVTSRSSEMQLTEEQQTTVIDVLSTAKLKRRKRKKKLLPKAND